MFGSPHLLGGPFVREVSAPFHQRHTAHGHQPANLGLDPQLGQPVPDGWVVCQGVAVLLVLLDPVDDVLIPAHGNQIPAGADPVQVQPHGADVPAIVLFAEHTSGWHPDIFEEGLVGPALAVGSAHGRRGIVLDGPQSTHRDAWSIHGDQENRDSPVPGSVGVGADHQVNVGRVVGRRGVHLLAVDNVFVAVLNRPALKACQVRAGLGLGETQGEHDIPADQSREEVFFLLVGSRRQEGRCAATSAANADTDPGKLLFNNVLVQPAPVLATVLLGPANPDPSLVGNLLVELPHQGTAAPLSVPFDLTFDLWGHVVHYKLTDLVSKGFLFR